ncbi:MAG: heat-inducible transcription repressor HrcA [Candidatus Latescibacteria bacterium]|jgi:heat-inducible transcriptional repressor|nr:heat-inducible transcription repressor HrcA [Candidatus Latescibacterota bacterium]MBT4136388.1 heat-inducible transcription repressor HrcA [Candidatus Latescibacterota bacterium]MBT5829220.1 heat-inducible transcription repressor HrcA [Candidatus Latescibacterota bacterium]
MTELTQREKAILDILIGTYVTTGEPVGSRTVSKMGLGLSAATIRNSMADLEEKGYLQHPHTSSGRVPSDKGYRYYVDMLMSREELAQAAQQSIRESIAHFREGNVETLLGHVSKLLADVSHNLGIALGPQFVQGVFERLEMVKLSESKLLVVMTIRSGLVKTMVMEVDSELNDDELQETRRVVNERLSGLSVGEIMSSAKERLESASTGSPKLLRLIAESTDSMFNVFTGVELHMDGTRNFFDQPDFTSDKLAGLIGMLEEKESVAHLLQDRGEDDFLITIGEEHLSPELQGCSLLTSRYNVGNVSGVIGIIGPTRLPYGRLVPLLQYMSNLTGEMLERK